MLPRDSESPSSYCLISSRISPLPGLLIHPKSMFYPYLELTNQPDCTVSLWPPGGSKGSANLVPVVTDYKAKEGSLPIHS